MKANSFGSLGVHSSSTQPDWSMQIGIAVIVRPDRNRAASGETALWLAVVEESIRSATAISQGKRPTCIDASPAGLANAIRIEAGALRAWSRSSQIGGLLWIADMIFGCTDQWIHPERIAATVDALLKTKQAEGGKPRKRTPVIFKLAAVRESSGE